MPEIKYLMDYPQYLPIVAFWNLREWHAGENSLDEIIGRYQGRMQRDRIPMTLIAIEDTMPVGTVSIKHDDLPNRPDLNPWLASLYVLPDYRGRDIGRILLRAGEDAARNSGVETLYLFAYTVDTVRGLYEREGWIYMEDAPFRGDIRVTIYHKKL